MTDFKNTTRYSPRKKKPTQVKVLAQNVNMSVLKVKRVLKCIYRRPYEAALMILELMPYRVSYLILKLIYSAAANANHNLGWNKAILFISKAEVTRSTIRKKFRPQERGRSSKIKRITCHITIGLSEIPPEFRSILDKSKI